MTDEKRTIRMLSREEILVGVFNETMVKKVKFEVDARVAQRRALLNPTDAVNAKDLSELTVGLKKLDALLTVIEDMILETGKKKGKKKREVVS